MNAKMTKGEWKHVKRGTTYDAIGDAEVQSSRPLREGDTLVVYVGKDGRLWARPSDEFHDGRFAPIPVEESPRDRAFYRAMAEENRPAFIDVDYERWIFEKAWEACVSAMSTPPWAHPEKPLTPDDRQALRNLVMEGMNKRMGMLRERFHEWRDWPGTWAFADIAVSSLQDHLKAPSST